MLAFALALVALAPQTPTQVPGWSGELWLDLDELALASVVTLSGQDVPASRPLPVPATRSSWARWPRCRRSS